MTRRLGRGGFLIVWLLLCSGQIAAIAQLISDAPAMAGLVVLLLQIAKVPFTSWRLYDVGLAPEDGIVALVPLANLELFFSRAMLATPDAETWTRRVARWKDAVGAISALRKGVTWGLRALPAMFPLVLVLAGISAGGIYGIGWLSKLMASGEEATLTLIRQGFAVGAILTGVYLMIQVLKRKTASRASWWPTLLFIPMLTFYFGMLLDANNALISVMLFSIGWYLASASIGGGLLALGWVVAGERVRKGESASVGNVFAERGRAFDVVVVHGAKEHLVQIGMQAAVIPGVYYALQMAFVDMVAVLEPGARAYRRSADLAYGIRRRLFILLYLYGIVVTLLGPLVVYALQGSEVAQAAFVDPTAASFASLAVIGIVAECIRGMLTLAMLAIYHDRVAVVDGVHARADAGG